MKTPAPADLQRWSEEVARDPASLAFIPLARAYRKQGRRDAALRLCLRGLEHHPTHVEAHALLAMLYFESGQRAKAYDEWSMVLRLEPTNFEALRGMGFYHLEQSDDISALHCLQQAGKLKPSDLAVQEALRMIHERQVAPPPAPPAAAAEKDPWEEEWEPDRGVEAGVGVQGGTGAVGGWEPVTAAPPAPPGPSVPLGSLGLEAPAGASAPPGLQAPPPAAAPPPPAQALSAVELPDDPTQLFAPLQKGGQILGALLLDAQGLVLAGSLSGESGSRAEMLGAILGPAIEEAARTSSHLALGGWQGILLEAEQALLHLAPVREGMIVLIAAKRQTPAGFMLRAASQAGALATRFLEVYA